MNSQHEKYYYQSGLEEDRASLPEIPPILSDTNGFQYIQPSKTALHPKL